MPIHRLMEAAAFDAVAVEIMTTAFDDTLRELSLDRADPRAEIVARKIIECATLGERDPARLRELGEAALGRRSR